MTKTKRSPEEELIITPDEAEELIERIRDGDITENEETAAAFLLLIHSIVYTESVDGREQYLRAAERVVMLYTNAFGSAATSLLVLAHDSLREAGRVSVELKSRTKKR